MRRFAFLGALLCLGAAPKPPPPALDLILAETPAPRLADYRLFTDAGDPPHGGPRGRGAGLELFGLSLSWGHHSGLIQSINPVLVWAAAAPSPAVS